MFNLITLDGFFEGKNHDISWHNVDEEFNKFAVEQTGEAGVLLFGRVTYELMASYWTTDDAIKDDPIITGQMNSISKIVVSKTLDKAEWNNTKLIKDNVEEEIKKLKAEEGKDIFIFGSSDLTVSLIKMGLVDQLNILVNPIVIGEGKRLFEGIDTKLTLKLLNTKEFKNGNVMLYYSL